MGIKKPRKKQVSCMVCGHPSQESICPTCQARIRGEATQTKQAVEKKGRPDTSRR